VSLLSEVLVISGVAMDLVGATVLSHAHNAESMVDIREEIGAEKSALGEKDALATQAQLLAEKRIGFFLLTLGLSLYLAGLVMKTTEGTWTMAALAAGVVVTGLAGSALWVRMRAGAGSAARSRKPAAPSLRLISSPSVLLKVAGRDSSEGSRSPVGHRYWTGAMRTSENAPSGRLGE
jgi:hypothetical protein